MPGDAGPAAGPGRGAPAADVPGTFIDALVELAADADRAAAFAAECHGYVGKLGEVTR
ncbi:MAG: hypothetical protein HQL37_16365 [Alphaproteobacteria bacterium]|nr:hypothetical protein [Alphaproteobacteria bacterium]